KLPEDLIRCGRVKAEREFPSPIMADSLDDERAMWDEDVYFDVGFVIMVLITKAFIDQKMEERDESGLDEEELIVKVEDIPHRDGGVVAE
ncbi:hypothetical protein KI387_035820, partial [Taxus chinensis]